MSNTPQTIIPTQQVLVSIVQLEYPAVWPTFFRDLIAAAHQGPGLADMLCRVMVAVDEDIISLEIPRWV